MSSERSSRILTFTESLIFSETKSPKEFKITDFYQNSIDSQFEKKYLFGPEISQSSSSFNNNSISSTSEMGQKIRRFKQIEKYLQILKEQSNQMAEHNQDLIEKSKIVSPYSHDGPINETQQATPTEIEDDIKEINQLRKKYHDQLLDDQKFSQDSQILSQVSDFITPQQLKSDTDLDQLTVEPMPQWNQEQLLMTEIPEELDEQTIANFSGTTSHHHRPQQSLTKEELKQQNELLKKQIEQLQVALNEKVDKEYMSFNDKQSSLYDTNKIQQFEQQLHQMKCQLQEITCEEKKMSGDSNILIQQETTQKTTIQNISQSECWSEEKAPSISRKCKRRQQLLDHIFKDTSNVTDRMEPDQDKTELSILDSLDNTNEIQKQLRDINQFQLQTKIAMAGRNDEKRLIKKSFENERKKVTKKLNNYFDNKENNVSVLHQVPSIHTLNFQNAPIYNYQPQILDYPQPPHTSRVQGHQPNILFQPPRPKSRNAVCARKSPSPINERILSARMRKMKQDKLEQQLKEEKLSVKMNKLALISARKQSANKEQQSYYQNSSHLKLITTNADSSYAYCQTERNHFDRTLASFQTTNSLYGGFQSTKSSSGQHKHKK